MSDAVRGLIVLLIIIVVALFLFRAGPAIEENSRRKLARQDSLAKVVCLDGREKDVKMKEFGGGSSADQWIEGMEKRGYVVVSTNYESNSFSGTSVLVVMEKIC